MRVTARTARDIFLKKYGHLDVYFLRTRGFTAAL